MMLEIIVLNNNNNNVYINLCRIYTIHIIYSKKIQGKHNLYLTLKSQHNCHGGVAQGVECLLYKCKAQLKPQSLQKQKNFLNVTYNINQTLMLIQLHQNLKKIKLGY
jgi:hypothetical protein